MCAWLHLVFKSFSVFFSFIQRKYTVSSWTCIFISCVHFLVSLFSGKFRFQDISSEPFENKKTRIQNYVCIYFYVTQIFQAEKDLNISLLFCFFVEPKVNSARDSLELHKTILHIIFQTFYFTSLPAVPIDKHARCRIYQTQIKA